MLPLVIIGALLTTLFLFVQMTRTAETLTDLGYVVGLSESWSELDPVIWGPASYLAAPIANALLTMQFEAFRFDADGILKMLPAFVIEPFGIYYEYTEKFEKLKYVRWYDASNIISGWGHLANNFGVIGMLFFNVLFGAAMVISARKNFFAVSAVLAAFIVGCRNAALYSVEDYFFEPSGLAEFLLLTLCFHLSKIDYAVDATLDENASAETAVIEEGVTETAVPVTAGPVTRVPKIAVPGPGRPVPWFREPQWRGEQALGWWHRCRCRSRVTWSGVTGSELLGTAMTGGRSLRLSVVSPTAGANHRRHSRSNCSNCRWRVMPIER